MRTRSPRAGAPSEPGSGAPPAAAWTRAARPGVTLSELMVALVILTVGVLGALGAFKFISTAVSQSRLKTIATNLAQEKMEVLKNKPYAQLLVTTAPVTSTGFDTNFVYDNANYPPEVFTMWGGPAMTRRVNVDYVGVTGASVSVLPYTVSDPGMKKITVYVTWTERTSVKKIQIDSYYEKPDAATLSTSINGQIRDAQTSAPVAAAYVQVLGAPKWHSYTDSAGNYNFSVSPGTYSVICSSAGYYPGFTNPALNLTAGLAKTWSPSLLRVATGTVSADSIYAVNPGLVISQVVASTIVPSGFDVQYIELFNPTTHQISISGGTGSGQLHSISLNFTSNYPGPRMTCTDIPLVYVTTAVPAGRYYVISNTSTFVLNSMSYTADAYYDSFANLSCLNYPTPSPWNSPPTSRPIMFHDHSGAAWLTDGSGATVDAVGWKNGSNVPINCEGDCIPLDGSHGLLRGDQIVRFSSPCAAGDAYGRANDSDSNDDDFYYNDTGSSAGLPYRLFNSTTPALPVIAGVPAQNAYVFANDGNSATILSSEYWLTGAQGQNCPASSFTLVGVATGTWALSAISGTSSGTFTNVATGSSAGFRVKVASGTTAPAWRTTGFHHADLPYIFDGGFAVGHVYGAASEATRRLNNILVRASSGKTTRTDSQGFYVLNTDTGTVTITANYNFDNPSYVSSDYDVTVTQVAAAAVPDFHLSQGGTFRGYVTAGTGALPSIVVAASNASGTAGQDTTDSTGYFYVFASTAATTYTVAPVLDPLQSYTSVAASPCTAGPGYALNCGMTTPGSTVFVGTFTVTGALGTISGRVLNSGQPITTGVLIMASFNSIADPPAAIYGSSAPAQVPIYSVSSQPDGSYSLEVRSSTSTAYSMRAFYPVVDMRTGAVTYTSKPKSGVSVGAGGSVAGQDFTWP